MNLNKTIGQIIPELSNIPYPNNLSLMTQIFNEEIDKIQGVGGRTYSKVQIVTTKKIGTACQIYVHVTFIVRRDGGDSIKFTQDYIDLDDISHREFETLRRESKEILRTFNREYN
jgi:hypothetical protein